MAARLPGLAGGNESFAPNARSSIVVAGSNDMDEQKQ
jgi:hypothetical protein